MSAELCLYLFDANRKDLQDLGRVTLQKAVYL